MLEAVWASALGASDGLRRRGPTVLFLITTVASVVGLAIAMRDLPAGTAYAVWVAVGATLTVIWAMVRGHEPVSVVKVALLAGIIACVIGLKVVS
jgi:quaternary ammonium compound-resistance protein SugE